MDMVTSEMKIGIVCEGLTDFVAIKTFVKRSLGKRGCDVEIIGLQPMPDETRAGAGWGEVFRWLEKYPPKLRMTQFLGGGLFGGGLSGNTCDLILIQLDSDIIGEEGFNKKIERSGHEVKLPDEPSERASYLKSIIEHFANFSDMTPEERRKHFPFPAIESTETWCIAAHSECVDNPERYKVEDLKHHFGCLVADVFGQQRQEVYANINKKLPTRQKVCDHLDSDDCLTRLEGQCAQYKSDIDSLFSLI
jgi:hypothetical protein